VSTNKVIAAAEFLGQKVTFINVDNLKDKSFLVMNPLGKCPVLETPNGFLTQSNAILRYMSYVAGHHLPAFENA
jgi:elongation factor 1-gamma